MKNNRKYRMYQKRIVYAVCLMMLVVSIMSCSHGKSLWSKYERPDSLLHATATSSALRDAAGIEGADSVGFGGVKWQEVFTDPQLRTLIEKGLEQNVDIFEASANVQKMEAALKAARLAFLPQVTFTPSGTLAKVVTGDKKGDYEQAHFHKIATEYTVIISGKVSMNGKVYSAGDIIIMEPGEATDFLCLEDGTTNVVVKLPGANNDKYLRFLWEVCADGIRDRSKWVLHAKGGEQRRWYGNIDTVVSWTPESINHYKHDKISRFPKEHILFRKGITWSLISSNDLFSMRLLTDDTTFNKAAATILFDNESLIEYFLGFLNTKITQSILRTINPTMNTNIKDILALPIWILIFFPPFSESIK